MSRVRWQGARGRRLLLELGVVLAMVSPLVAVAPAEALVASTVSLSASPSVSAPAESVVLSGVVAPVEAGRTVWLQRYGTTWSTVASVVTDSTGRFSGPVRAGVVGSKASWRAVARPTASAALAISVLRTVSVVRQTVSLTAPSSVETRLGFTLTGYGYPVRAGRVVVVQRLSGTSWIEVGRTTQSSTGRYSVSTNVSSVGRFTYRAVVAAWHGAAAVPSVHRVVSARAPYILLAPSTAIAAEMVKVTGKLPSVYSRPVWVQRWSGTSWVGLVRTTTSGTGSYATSFKAPARSIPMRSVAPQVTIAGKVRAQFVTGAKTLTVVTQTASLSMPATMLESGYSTARLSFGPVRTGRVVALQVVKSGVWTSVATTLQNSTGKASVTVTAGKPGSYSYRAWTAASSGAPAYASPTHTLVVTAQLVVSTTSFATATAGVGYTQSLTATGGAPGYTWSLASGSLPRGLSLSTVGQISGTPATLGTSAFQIQARDGRGTTASATVTMVVAPGPASGLPGQIRPETIAAGDRHSCAVTSGGGVKCWGDNVHGQLGHGSTFDAGGVPVYLYIVPVDVVGLSAGVASVSAGGGHSCAVTTSGAVKCWGYNGDGELGDGTKTDSNVPVGVVGLDSGVASVSAGPSHSCAVTISGALKCWGQNSHGQLGDGSTGNSAVPVDVVGLSLGVAAVATGPEHSCAVTTSGALKCWGYNYFGQLGDGTTSLPPDYVSRVPVGVVGLAAGVAAVSVGYATSCAVTTSGALKCWGYNGYGQLGNGTTSTARTPADVIGLGFGVVSVSLGSYHGCAVTTSGTVKCWGEGASGQLGNSAPTWPFGIWSSVEPIAVTRLEPGIATVAAGATHTCVLTTAGAMKCWGGDSRGQRGDGANDGDWMSNPIPADVVGLGPSTVAVPAR